MHGSAALVALFSAALLSVASVSALATATSSPPPIHVAAPPMHVIQGCSPAAALGYTVQIPGRPSFQAQSVALGNGSVNQSSMESEKGVMRRGRGTITIVKSVDAASPGLYQAEVHHTRISIVKITMRKAGGNPAYVVWYLSGASIISVNENRPNETIVFDYETISECSAPSGK
jgi:hypothetical protein